MSYGRYPYAAGGLGDFFKKAGKVVGGVIGGAAGLLVGGPGGAAAGIKLGSKIGGLAKGTPGVVAGASLMSPGPGFNLGPININPMGILPGGAPFVSMGKGPVAMENGRCPIGYHPNKQDGKYGAKGTYCVRNRTMNPSNGRAIGRANRRIRSGIKMFKRSLSIVGTSMKGKRVVPKKRR